MLSRRIFYGWAVLSALAFQIFYEGYLAHYLLVCLLALPLLSLALSLRGILGVRLELTPSAPQLDQGDGGVWQISVTTPSSLPVSRVNVALTVENSLTLDQWQLHVRCKGLTGRMEHTLAMDTCHCGQYTCQVEQIQAMDLLGLFSFPVPRPTPAQALVLPTPVPGDQLPELSQLPTHMSGTGCPSVEDYELREYQPGDPLRSIHWKLSWKFDGLVVREPAKHGLPQVAVTLDLYGQAQRLDRVLGRLWSVCLALLDQGIPHTIFWMDPEWGLQNQLISSHRQLMNAMAVILSRPACVQPPREPLHLSCLDHMPHLHITTGGEDNP